MSRDLKFKEGDIAFLNSGGPALTVTSNNQRTDLTDVFANWMKDVVSAKQPGTEPTKPALTFANLLEKFVLERLRKGEYVVFQDGWLYKDADGQLGLVISTDAEKIKSNRCTMLGFL